jgi:hypothetical protein
VSGLFARIRWRLVGWIMLIVGLILMVLGATIHVALERTLMDQVDRNLISRSEQMLPVLFGPADRRGRGDRDGYRGGVFYLGLLPDGSVLANPQQVATDGVTWPPTPEGRAPTFTTMLLNGELTRVFVRATGS